MTRARKAHRPGPPGPQGTPGSDATDAPATVGLLTFAQVMQMQAMMGSTMIGMNLIQADNKEEVTHWNVDPHEIRMRGFQPTPVDKNYIFETAHQGDPK